MAEEVKVKNSILSSPSRIKCGINSGLSCLRKQASRVLMVWIPAFAGMTFIFISGCTTINPATGRKEMIWISTPQEISMGESIHKELSQQFEFSYDSQVLARVQSIGAKLATVSDRQDFQYKFFVIEKDELNAFTVPSGRIYFYKGLLDKLVTDDEVAFVLAHEIGHSAARHTVKKFQASLGYGLLMNLILSQVGEGAQSVAGEASGAVMNVVFSAYGRKDEYQADSLGVKYMYLAGYDLQGAVKALAALEVEEKKGAGAAGMPLILRTHPFVADRIIAITNEIALTENKYGTMKVKTAPLDVIGGEK